MRCHLAILITLSLAVGCAAEADTDAQEDCTDGRCDSEEVTRCRAVHLSYDGEALSPNGRVDIQQWANGSLLAWSEDTREHSFEYDDAGQLVAHLLSEGDDTDVYTYVYDRDRLSRIEGPTNTSFGGDPNFLYDSRLRINLDDDADGEIDRNRILTFSGLDLAREELGSQIRTFAYDSLLQVSSIDSTFSGAPRRQVVHYTPQRLVDAIDFVDGDGSIQTMQYSYSLDSDDNVVVTRHQDAEVTLGGSGQVLAWKANPVDGNYQVGRIYDACYRPRQSELYDVLGDVSPLGHPVYVVTAHSIDGMIL